MINQPSENGMNRTMPNNGHWVSIALLAFFCLPIQSYAGISVGCDDAYVLQNSNKMRIDVAVKEGFDDTTNIQCALDAAVRRGIPLVQLGKGGFIVSQITVEDFMGSFQGTTRADTSLFVNFHGVDCQSMETGFKSSAFIKFVRGAPQLKFMTIWDSEDTCMDGSTLRSLVNFTGGNQVEDRSCSNDVIFGVVDRVDIRAQGSGRKTEAAISVVPEGEVFNSSCKNTLLGTFKLNRSILTDFPTGLVTSLRGGAQVDINFNSFNFTSKSVEIINSNQSTTITGNTFSLANTLPPAPGHQPSAVLVRSSRLNPPARTRLVIHNNDFTLQDTLSFAFVIGFRLQTGPHKVSLVVTDNTFNLVGDGGSVVGILGTDVDKALVSNNHFTGGGIAAIDVGSQFTSAVTGWSITGNTGLGSFTSSNADIIFRANANQNIVGPGQHASVEDSGTGNELL